MKLLVVVADQKEVAPMKRLLAQAGKSDYEIYMVNGQGFKSKPSMKQIRELKPVLDGYIGPMRPFDYIIASGETAARLVLDTSSVNINKLRGRDFEYAYGVRTQKTNNKKANKEAV